MKQERGHSDFKQDQHDNQSEEQPRVTTRLTRQLLTKKCAESRRHLDGGNERLRTSCFDFDLSLEDVEEQRSQFEHFEKLSTIADELATKSEGVSNGDEVRAEETASPEESEQEGAMIEVVPGMMIPFRSSSETWAAIMEGRVIVTMCSNCSLELTCIDDVELVICADCWVFSPVDQNIGNLSLTDQENPSCSACIGVKTEDIFTWLGSKNEQM
jgi:hypothetical protein